VEPPAGKEEAMSDYEEKADALEREVDDMERRGRGVEEDIEREREEWERKKGDPTVPGAGGDPERAEGDLPPEADYPSKGD
jgi:hypothetical protein